jgi:hypothetical protein
MTIPLHGFLQGDTIGLLILAEENDTVRGLASRLQRAASVRVAPRPDDRARVLYRGKALDPDLTLAHAGIEPLERFDVIFESE